MYLHYLDNGGPTNCFIRSFFSQNKVWKIFAWIVGAIIMLLDALFCIGLTGENSNSWYGRKCAFGNKLPIFEYYQIPFPLLISKYMYYNSVLLRYFLYCSVYPHTGLLYKMVSFTTKCSAQILLFTDQQYFSDSLPVSYSGHRAYLQPEFWKIVRCRWCGFRSQRFFGWLYHLQVGMSLYRQLHCNKEVMQQQSTQ